MTSSTRSRKYLFVYGTLRKHTKNQMYQLLTRYADFIGEGTFNGRLYDIGKYPGAVPSNEPDDIVKGEVYALRKPDRILKVLDEYEGCGPDEPIPTEFRREETIISLNTGEQVNAWIYIYNRSTNRLKEIRSGDYLKFREVLRT